MPGIATPTPSQAAMPPWSSSSARILMPRRGQRLRVANRGKSADAAQRLAQQVRRHQIGLAGANVDGDDGSASRIDVEEGRFAAAKRLAGRAFDDETALEQIADEEADAAASDAHGASEVGAGNRLVRAHEIQDDLAIDLARRALGGDLKANRIDLSH